MLPSPKTPLSDSSEDPLVTVNYNYFFGTNWEECGVSKVDGFLTALGFSVREEVTAFCASTNVFNEFSTNEFIRKYVSVEDRQRLVKFGKARSQFKLVPDIMNFKSASMIFEQNQNPGYEDFFQILFSWLTYGDSIPNRNDFIAQWRQNPAGGPGAAVRNPYKIETDATTVRKSFQDKVKAFLQQRRSPQTAAAQSADGSNPFVDAVHYVKIKLLNVILKPSDWGYISGNDVTVGIQTPLKLISAGAGGGTFGVYEQKQPEKVYPLRFVTAGVGTGFGPSSPLNINVNPSAFPSVGKIYHGLKNSIFGSASFYGTFVTLSAGARTLSIKHLH